MEASGLLNFWEKQASRGKPEYCLKKDHSKMPSIRNKRNEEKKSLTIKGLSGAFVVLGFGYSLAIAVFFVEIYQNLKLNNPKKNSSQTNFGIVQTEILDKKSSVIKREKLRDDLGVGSASASQVDKLSSNSEL